MTRFTGLSSFDWLVVAAASLCVSLVVQARRPLAGPRVLGLSAGPAATGLACLAVVALSFPETFERLFSAYHRAAMVAVLLAALAVAMVIVDFLITRVLPRFRGGANEAVGARAQLALFVTLGALGLLGLALVSERVHSSPAEGSAATTSAPATTTTEGGTSTTAGTDAEELPKGWRVVVDHALPSAPLGMAVLPDRDLVYMTTGDGRIVRFALSAVLEDTLDLVTVAQGLEYPRGVAVAGNTLFVAELGRLPCPGSPQNCLGKDLDAADPLRGAAEILRVSNGRLTAFTVDDDGDLREPRVVVDGLPVTGTTHGVNGVATGPDGAVYVAIGNLELPDLEHANRDWLGTVLRVTDEGVVEVFARGLRNVFGLDFGVGDDLWGVDNDGEAYSGWRGEEVLLIGEGDDFGFPIDGTLNPPQVRTRGPVWIADTVGSGGTAWAEEAGLGPSLLLGSCGRLDLLRLTDFDGEWRVAWRTDYVEISAIPGCVSAISPVAPDLVLVAIVSGDNGVLKVFQVSPEAR